MIAPDPQHIAADVARALAEDIGPGDVTAALIPPNLRANATVISREDAVLCGQGWFDAVFHTLDGDAVIQWHAQDGMRVGANQILCTLTGNARALLSGERAALNFLQTLSGTATVARRYVDAVSGTRARVLDTRKTIPGLRRAQKYAVACGGAQNHRVGLFDAILIKENHIAAAGSIAQALAQAAQQVAPGFPIEIEVEDLTQLKEALAAGARRVLLDNFDRETLVAAVRVNEGRAQLEASGGVTLDNIAAIARTGVDFISCGDITKNLRAVDLSLRLETK